MEYIKKEELIEGEIYTNINNGNIVKYLYLDEEKRVCGKFININETLFNSNLEDHPGRFTINNLRLATSEEKHWLNSCITADKFITFEEAMKTFIPEYVEILSGYFVEKEEIGKIYKISDDFPKHLRYCQNYNWNNFLKHKDCFKPSTKEAYDAQFVVKEPEFVLPEKWYIQRNSENFEVLNEWENHKRGSYVAFNKDNGCSMFSDKDYSFTKSHNILGYTEITFEQFKKYVLKEETPVQNFIKLHNEIVLGPRRSALMDINIIDKEIIEPLPQFKVIESIETITKVENNEGNQFFIGDVVKSLSNVIYNITKFEYNEDKTQIIAILNETSRFDINQIEHYVEPKVEVKDDFILPEKWCIKRNAENDKIVTDYINKIASIPHNYLLNNRYNPYLHNITVGCCSYYKVIENYTEITFDQFKKYVLKEEIKGEIDN